MAIDIKKIAIVFGCIAIFAVVVGRINSGSNTDGYQPIASLSHLAETSSEEMAQSVTIEDAKPLASLEYEQPASLVEPDNQIVFDNPELLQPSDQSSDTLELELMEDSSMEIFAPAHLDLPPADSATEQLNQEIILPAEESTLPENDSLGNAPLGNDPLGNDSLGNDSLGNDWKRNPFITTGAPPITTSDSNVQPASMAVTTQAVRSLNDIHSVPGGVQSRMVPSVPTSSMVKGRTSFAPTKIRLSESAAQKAVHHIEYGKSLTRRGATYAARHEFFSALRVIAEANDASINGNEFSTALAKAIRAMKEAEDFNVPDSQSFAVLDVAETIEAHKTKLFTQVEARRMTPLSAMQQYYRYAGEQLDYAGGRNVVTAEALHCLGKLHSVISSQKPANSNNLDIAQAIVFHKSSLLSNSNNPASANELGVLMAKSGNLKEATSLFKRSLISQSTPQAWSNLAKTHQRMGEQDMAQMAQAEIAVAAQTTSIATAGIQWIDTPQFNAMAPLEFEPRVAQKAPPVALPQTKSDQTQEDEKPEASIAQRIKNWF